MEMEQPIQATISVATLLFGTPRKTHVREVGECLRTLNFKVYSAIIHGEIIQVVTPNFVQIGDYIYLHKQGYYLGSTSQVLSHSRWDYWTATSQSNSYAYNCYGVTTDLTLIMKRYVAYPKGMLTK